mgnify:CR=1 FL=1
MFRSQTGFWACRLFHIAKEVLNDMGMVDARNRTPAMHADEPRSEARVRANG